MAGSFVRDAQFFGCLDVLCMCSAAVRSVNGSLPCLQNMAEGDIPITFKWL